MQNYCEELSKIKKWRKKQEVVRRFRDKNGKRDKDNRYASRRDPDLSARTTRDVGLAVRLMLHHSKFKGAG